MLHLSNNTFWFYQVIYEAPVLRGFLYLLIQINNVAKLVQYHSKYHLHVPVRQKYESNPV